MSTVFDITAYGAVGDGITDCIVKDNPGGLFEN